MICGLWPTVWARHVLNYNSALHMHQLSGLSIVGLCCVTSMDHPGGHAQTRPACAAGSRDFGMLTS